MSSPNAIHHVPANPSPLCSIRNVIILESLLNYRMRFEKTSNRLSPDLFDLGLVQLLSWVWCSKFMVRCSNKHNLFAFIVSARKRLLIKLEPQCEFTRSSGHAV